MPCGVNKGKKRNLVPDKVFNVTLVSFLFNATHQRLFEYWPTLMVPCHIYTNPAVN